MDFLYNTNMPRKSVKIEDFELPKLYFCQLRFSGAENSLNFRAVYLFIALPKYKWLWIMAFFAANAR